MKEFTIDEVIDALASKTYSSQYSDMGNEFFYIITALKSYSEHDGAITSELLETMVYLAKKIKDSNKPINNILPPQVPIAYSRPIQP